MSAKMCLRPAIAQASLIRVHSVGGSRGVWWSVLVLRGAVFFVVPDGGLGCWVQTQAWKCYLDP